MASRRIRHRCARAVGRPATGACSVPTVRVPASLRSTRWPRPKERSRSSSTRSGPSSPGSVITFDPASLERRVAELEQELNAPGFWDDQERAQKISAEHARVAKRLEIYRAPHARLRGRRELLELDAATWRARSRRRSCPLRARARPAPGGRALRRRVRRRRRRRHAPVGHGRHRRAGLGRDDAAHVRALGRRARLQGRAARGEPGRGGGPQVARRSRRRRERLRDPQGRARQAPPRAPVARSTARTAATPRSRR